MFKKILLPTDGSELSERAVLAGVALAREVGAEVVGLSVAPAFHTLTLDPEMLEETAEQFHQSAKLRSARYLSFVADSANSAGVRYSGETGVSDDPWHVIIDTAQLRQCDLVVMASHGRRGIKGALLGSETQKVLVHSKVPVLVYR